MSGEFARIARLIAGLPRGEGVVIGPGDDAAVLRPGADHDLVATTDAFVEGRHYHGGLTDPATLGHRLAAANLSDVAAMGGRPRWALLSLVLPPELDPAFVERAERAFAAALAGEGASVVGGNLAAAAGPAVWSVTLLGEVPRGRAWTRGGARAGDVIAVTGAPGRAAAVLAAQAAGREAWAALPAALREAWSAPPCRVRAALAMSAAGGITACVDVSDGLGADLAHLARASGVDVELALAAWTDDPLLGTRSQEFRLAPGDDYELVLAIAPDRVDAVSAAALATGTGVTTIGRCVPGGGALFDAGAGGARRPLAPRGWDHFG